MDERKQFTFYRSFWEAVQTLPKKDRLPVLEAIMQYSLYGEQPKCLTLRQFCAFESIKPKLDAEIRESKEGRNSEEYKLWRASVFSRDNFTCQICGRRGVRLNAHHIKSYADHRELRYVVSNGITLCEPCHKLVHKVRKGGGKFGMD